MSKEEHTPKTENKSKKSPEFQAEADAAHKLEIAQRREYYVVQRNDMAQNQRFAIGKGSGKSLSLTEEKVLNYLISQIKPDATHLEPMVMDIQTFCEVCGLAQGRTDNCYPQVKEAVDKLASRVMWLTCEDGSETTVRYIERATMTRKSGKVKIEFDKMMEPYLINLAGNYFQFSYHNILAMTSKYSVQLYKLLKSYYFRYPCVRFEIEDLKERLDATHYKRFSDFKDRVITPSVKDINTYSDLSVTLEYEKSGRAVSHIIFSMKNLEESKKPEEAAEARHRYYNVEREIEPDFKMFEKYLD